MPNTPDPQAAKAEALLLRFAAEAHRRKWSYDRGLDDDGVPVKSEAFDALHRLGEEMRTALEELRRTPAVVPSAAETTNRAALSDADRQFLTFALDLAFDRMVSDDGFTDEDEAALEKLRRLAAEEQPAETQDALPGPGTPRCATCTHPKSDHDGRADHRARFSPLVAGEPWCHACEAPCDYAERPAVGEQPDTQTREARVGRCSAVMIRVHHAPHGWEPQPGMDPVCCPGYPQPGKES